MDEINASPDLSIGSGFFLNLRPVSSWLRWRDEASTARSLGNLNAVGYQGKVAAMSGVTTYQTDWMIEGDVLKKGFKYCDLIETGSVHYSFILITKNQSRLTKIFSYTLDFVLSPNPWPNTTDNVVVGKLCLGETSAEQSCVRFSFLHKNGAAVLSAASRESTRSFLLCLGECRRMRLIMGYVLGKQLEIPILNDEQFVDIAEGFFV
jgi:hypothetical protein